MQESISMIIAALVDGQPRILNLYDILSEYLKHQKDVVTRRTIYDKKKAEARAIYSKVTSLRLTILTK